MELEKNIIKMRMLIYFDWRKPMSEDKVILGFETSCDETAIAIMRGEELLVNTISSQVDIHEKFGGVVPEVASRAHAEMIRNIFHSSLNSANLQISDIDSVATTDGPGLVGSLLVRALSFWWMPTRGFRYRESSSNQCQHSFSGTNSFQLLPCLCQ